MNKEHTCKTCDPVSGVDSNACCTDEQKEPTTNTCLDCESCDDEHSHEEKDNERNTCGM